MSEGEITTKKSSGISPTGFLLRRIHSLTGIVPIGGFLLFHFFENASARHGAAAFDETVEKIASMPYMLAAELGILMVPILFHAIYGLFMRSNASYNTAQWNHYRNFAYTLQRLTGFIAFIYIFYHVMSTRVWSVFVKGEQINYADMHQMLSVPWIFAFYLIGIISVVYHFANGIWSFSVTWGLVTSAEGQKRLSYLSVLIFAVLAVVGCDIAWTFRYNESFLSVLTGGAL